MTRINLITPSILTDQHLLAEYRELPMVHAALRRSTQSKSWKLNRVLPTPIPDKFCLGSGHVLFFYDKLFYLEMRYQSLREEMVTRGWRPDPDRHLSLEGIPKEFRSPHDWKPDRDALNIIRERLLQKLDKKPGFYKYKGIPYAQSQLVHLYESWR